LIFRIEKIGLSLEVDDELLYSFVEEGKGHYPMSLVVSWLDITVMIAVTYTLPI